MKKIIVLAVMVMISPVFGSENGVFNELKIGKYGSAYAGDDDPFILAAAYGSGAHDLLIYGETGTADLNLKLLDGDLEMGPYSTPYSILYNNGDASFKNILLGKMGVPSRNLHISKWGTSKQIRLERRGDNVGYIEIGGDSQGFHVISDDGTRLFTVSPSGNVGVGNSEPGHTLHVEGAVYANEFLSEINAWADYVFDENYPLRSFDDLKQYIQNNKHLPGVPSESEVKQNAVNLNELQGIFLSKIEENVLYILKLKEENEALKKRLSSLEARLERLEN